MSGFLLISSGDLWFLKYQIVLADPGFGIGNLVFGIRQEDVVSY